MKPFALIKLRAQEAALRSKLQAIEYQIACASRGKVPGRVAPSKVPFAILRLLESTGPLTVAEVSRQLDADRATVQVALQRLLGSGYILKLSRGVYQARPQMRAVAG